RTRGARTYASRSLGRRVTIPEENRDLGLALLVAEAAEGIGYEPVAVVVSVNEARELSVAGFASRCRRLERGGVALCPAQYVVWAQGVRGGYQRVQSFDPSEL